MEFDSEKDMYKLCCKAGVLEGLFARNAFDKIDSSNLDIEMREDTIVGIREAAKELSVAGGQGMMLCNCKKGTCGKGTRCKCFLNNVLCNSRCHGRETNHHCVNL